VTSAAGVRGSVNCSRRAGWSVITVTGDVDEACVGVIKHAFDAALPDGRFVIVDISDASIVDGSAHELLDGMEALLRAFNGHLQLIDGSTTPW
jgi:anti-anti-sigma regulatory factor